MADTPKPGGTPPQQPVTKPMVPQPAPGGYPTKPIDPPIKK
jgi:hypothetical protein